jgi:CRP-like cAMP-binding protein
MVNPLARKLESFADLLPADLDRLDNLCADVHHYKAGEDLIKEGDRPEEVFLLLKGWACRYKILPEGSRQIVAYLVPGDLCDIQIFILKEMDHAIGVLSDAQVASIPKQKMLRLFGESPELFRALWWSTLVDESILREWLVNMGRREAYHRIAHLFAELWVRLNMVGATDNNAFDLPLTQADLGDTVGLTSVHVNRTLKRLRAERLIDLSRGRLRLPDVGRLMEITDFQPNYLHLERRAADVQKAMRL